MSSDDAVAFVTSTASSSSLATTAIHMGTTFVWNMSKLVVGLGGVVAVLLYVKQDSLLYFPAIGGIPKRPRDNPKRYRNPSEHQIPYEDLHIPCADGVTIHAWLLLRDGTTATSSSSTQRKGVPTLLFFHGNAGNIGLRLPNALQMMQYLNVNVLMVEYRGYGDSDDVTPDEAGLKLDAQAALEYTLSHLHDKIDTSRLFVFGRSLGGAVAFHLAQYAQDKQLPLAGVIVENTFTSISDMVDAIMPYLAPFKALVLRIGWNSGLIAPSLQLPVMFLAGERDELVPHAQMLQLYECMKETRLKRMHIIPGGTHNESWLKGGSPYWDATKQFMVDAMKANDGVVATGGVTTSSSSTVDTTSGESAIPIMPSRILGMAQESMRNNSSSVEATPDKKEL